MDSIYVYRDLNKTQILTFYTFITHVINMITRYLHEAKIHSKSRILPDVLMYWSYESQEGKCAARKGDIFTDWADNNAQRKQPSFHISSYGSRRRPFRLLSLKLQTVLFHENNITELQWKPEHIQTMKSSSSSDTKDYIVSSLMLPAAWQ